MATIPHTAANEIDVLEAVVVRIVASNLFDPQFNSSTCYYSLDPQNDISTNPGDLVCVVAPDSFGFDQEMLVGGGEDQCLQKSSITIAIHNTMQLDESNKSTITLNQMAFGLLTIKKSLLKLLTNWTPATASGMDQVLIAANPLMPVMGHYGRKPGAPRKSASVEVSFSYDINLDLS